MPNNNAIYAPNMQVRQMEVNRLNNRSVVYIVEDHGTLQDLMVQGNTTNDQRNINGNHASKLMNRYISDNNHE